MIATKPEVKTFDITENAILVSLSIKEGSLYARSKTISHEAAEKHSASVNWVRGTITKLSSQARAGVTAIKNEARATLYRYTLPWDDNGYRLCPAENYAALRSKMDEYEDKFREAVSMMADDYPQLRREYEKQVGDLAQETPFPTKRELLEGFDFALEELALKASSDVRLKHVDNRQLQEIRSRIENNMAARMEEAQTEIVQRLIEHVARVKEQTSKADRKIFGSLFGNLEELVEILPALNLTNDPEISRLINRVKADLTGIDAVDVRKNEKFRKQTNKVASSILDDLKNYKG